MNKYSEEIQELYIQFLINDPDSFARARAILSHTYFDLKFRSTVKFIADYVDQYHKLPSYDQINAKTGLNLEQLEKTKIIDHADWFLSEFELFCRHKAIELAIESSMDLLQKGNYGLVEQKVKEAVLISLHKDLGTNYFKNPKDRLIRMRDNSNLISTGWHTLDKKLFGGFTRGTLNIFAAASGVGKSLFLQNYGLNMVEAGLNVLYFSLELSEDLLALRLDAMTSGFSTKDVFKNIDEVENRIVLGKKKNKWGHFQIKYMPAGTTTNDLKSYVKEYQIQTGIKIDAVIVDYLDLMHPNSIRISPSDLFIKDKYVSEELRSFAMELDVLFVTASQLNRCLSLDAKVLTKRGLIEIKDILCNDHIWTDTGWKLVTKVYPQQKQNVYKIRTKSGKEIICSSKHFFPTPAGLQSLNTGLQVGNKVYVKPNSDN